MDLNNLDISEDRLVQKLKNGSYTDKNDLNVKLFFDVEREEFYFKTSSQFIVEDDYLKTIIKGLIKFLDNADFDEIKLRNKEIRDYYDMLEKRREEIQKQKSKQEPKQELKQERIDYRNSNAGYVYFIKELYSGRYKIGIAKNLDHRLNTFNVKLPFEIELIHVIHSKSYRKTEELLHEHFKDKRTNGEWFELDDKDIEDIKLGNFPKIIHKSIDPEKEIA